MPDIFDANDVSLREDHEAAAQPKVRPENQSDRPHRHVDEYSEVMKAEIPSRSFWSAFLPKPVAFAFDSQDKTENIVLVLRQHPVTQLKNISIIALSCFVPFLMQSVGLLSFLPGNYQIAAFILWYLLISGFSLEAFLTWFFSVYIVTDERVIDVDFVSLIYKDISTAKIDKIEDVRAVTGGAIQSLVDYGTVFMQTAGAKAELQFENIPQPAKVTKLLNELILEEEQEKIEGRAY